MEISVVMATCDGQRYLPGQLASLMGQTRLPDEVLVVDDASTDDTVTILEDFASEAPFKVRLEHNPERLGSTLTYQRGISLCTGDLIALCDQDDLWMPQKLARMERLMVDHPEALFAFTDAALIDETDSLLPERMWAARSFGPGEQESLRADPFGVLVHRSLVTGCTVMFRAAARSLLLPIPQGSAAGEPLIHDRWLSLVLSAAGPVVALDEPLVAYRLHPEQQVGLPATSPGALFRHLRSLPLLGATLPTRRFHHLEHLQELQRRVEASGMVGATTRNHVDAVVAHLNFRKEQGDSSRPQRIIPVLREALAGGYHRHSNGLSSILADLLLP